MLALTSITALAAALEATPPAFASDYYVGEQSALAINQGGYKINNGICCSKTHSSNCKLQAMNSGGDVYEQGSKERTRTDSARGAVVSWWGSVKKQMAVVPGAAVNSTHKFACAAFCPLDGKYAPSLRIGDGQKGPFDKPKDKGSVAITQPASIGNTTKVCEHWHWTETLLYIIPMSVTDFFVDMSTKPPSPFFQSQVIKPFNKEIGEENASFIDYQPKDVSEYFDIDPDSISKCQKASKCSNDPPPPSAPPAESMAALEEQGRMLLRALSPHHAALDDLLEPKSFLEQAEEHAKALGAAKPPPLPPMPNVTFVKDFTAEENMITQIAQGSTFVDGDPCCMSDSPFPQCQVQLGHQQGTRYIDVTNQRARFEDAVSGENVVDDYTALKSMLINVTGGVETCEEYCPIDPRDKLEPFDPFDPFDAVKDLGKTTFEGKAVNHYQWADKILKIITMQTTDFYADISNPKAAIPVFALEELTPLGRKPPIGVTNHSWANVKGGAPDPKKFKIAGMDTCPKSKKCQQQSKQAHRYGLKQLHTAARYLDAVEHHVV